MHVGLAAIFPIRNDMRVSMESRTSSLVLPGSFLALSMNSEHSSIDSMSVLGSAYKVRVEMGPIPCSTTEDEEAMCGAAPPGFSRLSFSAFESHVFSAAHGMPTTIGISSTYPLSLFHCMLSSVLKYASSKHMYGFLAFGGPPPDRSRTMAGVSCTRMDCCRLTTGELVGNVPHTLWSPNMPPKQLPRCAPLPVACI